MLLLSLRVLLMIQCVLYFFTEDKLPYHIQIDSTDEEMVKLNFRYLVQDFPEEQVIFSKIRHKTPMYHSFYSTYSLFLCENNILDNSRILNKILFNGDSKILRLQLENIKLC